MITVEKSECCTGSIGLILNDSKDTAVCITKAEARRLIFDLNEYLTEAK